METELKLPSEWPEDFTYTDEGGLTPEQAAERMSAGRGNVMDSDQGKSLKRDMSMFILSSRPSPSGRAERSPNQQPVPLNHYQL